MRVIENLAGIGMLGTGVLIFYHGFNTLSKPEELVSPNAALIGTVVDELYLVLL